MIDHYLYEREDDRRPWDKIPTKYVGCIEHPRVHVPDDYPAFFCDKIECENPTLIGVHHSRRGFHPVYRADGGVTYGTYIYVETRPEDRDGREVMVLPDAMYDKTRLPKWFIWRGSNLVGTASDGRSWEEVAADEEAERNARPFKWWVGAEAITCGQTRAKGSKPLPAALQGVSAAILAAVEEYDGDVTIAPRLFRSHAVAATSREVGDFYAGGIARLRCDRPDYIEAMLKRGRDGSLLWHGGEPPAWWRAEWNAPLAAAAEGLK